MTAIDARKLTLEAGDIMVGPQPLSKWIAEQDRKIAEAASKGMTRCFVIMSDGNYDEYIDRLLDYYKANGFIAVFRTVDGYGSGWWLEW